MGELNHWSHASYLPRYTNAQVRAPLCWQMFFVLGRCARSVMP